ncbi:MAG TPA: hypothetical protein DDZ81_19020 [Acetobacteraceae bacterium]|nr:hypothetical protein [Acetobacteraceae bacterium]
MTDTLSPKQRSARMALVRSRNTKPELLVRRYLHASGLRYRLNQRIAGTRPDVVFKSRRIAVFVHGCMWHQHADPNCKLARMPKSRLDFWEPKLRGNRDRDERQGSKLRSLGWTVLIVWECEIGRRSTLEHLAETIRRSRRN